MLPQQGPPCGPNRLLPALGPPLGIAALLLFPAQRQSCKCLSTHWRDDFKEATSPVQAQRRQLTTTYFLGLARQLAGCQFHGEQECMETRRASILKAQHWHSKLHAVACREGVVEFLHEGPIPNTGLPGCMRWRTGAPFCNLVLDDS